MLRYVHKDHKDCYGQEAQDVHLDFHTALMFVSFVSLLLLFLLSSLHHGLMDHKQLISTQGDGI